MKFFNFDLHVSVIADLKKIFEEMGHEVTSWSGAGGDWIFKRKRFPEKVDVVNEDNWWRLDKEKCDAFYERYKDELSQYDAFICCHPPCFSLLFEKFNKPIIIQCSIRYEAPFNKDAEKWEYFNEYLRKGIDSGRIFVVANSEYDKRYFEFFVKRECLLIPNLCEYTNSKWTPQYNHFIFSSRLNIDFKSQLIIHKHRLGRYEWSELAKFLGQIIIPYNVSTMSIFEHYTANIPMFFPSHKFMMELYEHYGRGEYDKTAVLSEISWCQVSIDMPEEKRQRSIIDCDRENDPNDYKNLEIVSNWLKYADFYNQDWMPFIIYFDSFDDLVNKVHTTNLIEVSNKMKDFNIIRKQKVYSSWQNIIKKIEQTNG